MNAQEWVHASFSVLMSFLSVTWEGLLLPALILSPVLLPALIPSPVLSIWQDLHVLETSVPFSFPGIPRNMGFFRAMRESSFSCISVSLCYLGPKAALRGPWFSLCDFHVEFFSACLSLLSPKGVTFSPWAWLGNRRHLLSSLGVKPTNVTAGFSHPVHSDTCRQIFGYLHSHMCRKQPNWFLV